MPFKYELGQQMQGFRLMSRQQTLIRQVVFLVAFGPAAFGQGPDVARILNNVRDAYANAKTYQFVGQVETWQGPGDRQKVTVDIALRRSDRLRMGMQGTGLIIVKDDKISFQEPGSATREIKREPMDMDGVWGDFLEYSDRAFAIRYRGFASSPKNARLLREETIDADGKHSCYVVEISIPDNPVYVWWVDQRRFIVLREDMMGKSGHGSSVTFATAKVNEELPESLFEVPKN
jgi:outer membrane lipoprotein-sorting protein